MKKYLGVTVCLLMLALCACGSACAEELDISILPDMTIPAYEVIVDDLGVSLSGVKGAFITPDAELRYGQNGEGTGANEWIIQYDGELGGGKFDSESSPYYQMDAYTNMLLYTQISVIYGQTENSQYCILFPADANCYAKEYCFRGALLLWLMEDQDAGVFYRVARCENDDRILLEEFDAEFNVLACSLVENGEKLAEDAESSALYQYLHGAYPSKNAEGHLWPETCFLNAPIPENGEAE